MANLRFDVRKTLIQPGFSDDFYPRPPSAPTGIVVGHCVRPVVYPSVRPEGRYRPNSLIGYRHKIRWDGA